MLEKNYFRMFQQIGLKQSYEFRLEVPIIPFFKKERNLQLFDNNFKELNTYSLVANGPPANPVRALEHLIYSVWKTLEKRL